MVGAVNHMHFDPGRKQLLIGSDAGVIAALSRTGGLRACSRRRRARPLASLARAVWRQALRPFVTTDALLFDGDGRHHLPPPLLPGGLISSPAVLVSVTDEGSRLHRWHPESGALLVRSGGGGGGGVLLMGRPRAVGKGQPRHAGAAGGRRRSERGGGREGRAQARALGHGGGGGDARRGGDGAG